MDNSSEIITSNLSWSCASCARASGGHAPSERDLSPAGHVVVAVCLGFIGTFGFVNNAIVLLLFCRHKPLRSPINCMLVSISVSDLLVCVLGTPISFAASARGRWLIGARGCVWYGFINSFLGIVSLISLAALSYERYCTMMGAMQANITRYKKVFLGITFSWIYSLVWVVPPLFGWSQYGPEGPVIVYSYGKLLHAIKQVTRIHTALSRKREQRVLLLVVTMVVCYLLCWLPYGIMALVVTFGEPGVVTPEASIAPSLLAKTSTVINPIIYIFMNKQFYRCFRDLLLCSSSDRASNYGTSSKVTKSLRNVRRANAPDTTLNPDAVCSPDNHKSVSQPDTCSPAGPVKPVVSLVVYYHE